MRFWRFFLTILSMLRKAGTLPLFASIRIGVITDIDILLQLNISVFFP